jgi:hypothetical protein
LLPLLRRTPTLFNTRSKYSTNSKRSEKSSTPSSGFDSADDDDNDEKEDDKTNSTHGSESASVMSLSIRTEDVSESVVRDLEGKNPHHASPNGRDSEGPALAHNSSAQESQSDGISLEEKIRRLQHENSNLRFELDRLHGKVASLERERVHYSNSHSKIGVPQPLRSLHNHNSHANSSSHTTNNNSISMNLHTAHHTENRNRVYPPPTYPNIPPNPRPPAYPPPSEPSQEQTSHYSHPYPPYGYSYPPYHAPYPNRYPPPDYQHPVHVYYPPYYGHPAPNTAPPPPPPVNHPHNKPPSPKQPDTQQ